MRIAYLVHDLNDPSVARRIRMLRAGGADVIVAGFWRGMAPPAHIDGAPTVALGQSFEARLAQRGILAGRHAFAARGLRARLAPVDLYLARNLEMLAVAVAAARPARTPVVYEMLDIHRLLLGRSVLSRALRRMEGLLMRRTALLITSSPGFVRAYFRNADFARPRLPTFLLENKPLHLDEDAASGPVSPDLPPGPPWVIGWFGMIRCRRSLETLARLARGRPDLVRVRIFGRPAEPVREPLAGLARAIPPLEFGGAYEARDLARLYADTHFSWAIDYFEEHGNSEWLLPNRIYEAGSAGAVSLALRRTETGRWLAERDLGVLFDDPQSELEDFLETLTAARYRALKDAARNAPRSHFVAGRADCVRLADALADVVRGRDLKARTPVLRAAV